MLQKCTFLSTSIRLSQSSKLKIKQVGIPKQSIPFLLQMKAEDMPVTLAVYEHLLEACSTSGQIEKAKDVVTEMRAVNIPLSDKCCLALLKTLSLTIQRVQPNSRKRDRVLM